MIDFPFIKISFEYPNCRSTIGFLFENMTGKDIKWRVIFEPQNMDIQLDPSMSIVM